MRYLYQIFVTLTWATIALILLMSLMSYSANDPSWSYISSHSTTVSNLAGSTGAWLSDILYMTIGAASWWFIIFAFYEAIRVWYDKTQPHGVVRTTGYLFLVLATTGLLALLPMNDFPKGIVGQIIASGLINTLGLIGAWIFLAIFIFATTVFSFNIYHKKPILSATSRKNSKIADPDVIFANMTTTSTENSTSTTTIPLETPINQLTSQTTDNNPPLKEPPQPTNHLHEFLDEAGFIKEPNQPKNGFPTINDRLTEKLDARLYNEVIKDKNAPKPVRKNIQTALPSVRNQALQAQKKQPPQTQISPFAIPDDDNWLTVNVVETDNQATLSQPVTKPNFTDELDSFADLAKLGENLTKAQQSKQVLITENNNLAGLSSLTQALQNPIDQKTQVVPKTETTDDGVDSFNDLLALSDTLNQQISQQKNTSINQPSPLVKATPKSQAMQTAQYRKTLSAIPSLELLDSPNANQQPSYTAQQLEKLAKLLENKLQDFNIKAQVVNAEPGPVVTRFEVDLAAGIKASKVTGISKDLARSLSMASVRVVEVIPGKPYIGIEVPNPTRQTVRLIELLKTSEYQNPQAIASMAMGKDIAGRVVITDLAKAPHMLVAGTTGSGKSVLVNAMLLSLLLKYTPNHLRLILIDPKQLELANYNDIPHLLTPVVTDMNEAASALSWCVAEMERRYQLMSLFKVRKLDEFNKKIIQSEQNGNPLLDPLWRPNDSVSQDKPKALKPLPLIVIVADEFADMIMQVGKQAEELITRLAQKSRAAGIHLILATQRPSVDVITGLIKANIPVRAALRVNSKVDSRTILDAGGAEDMLGHGDMLFLGPGQIEPTRIHGAFVSDSEVNRICDAWRERGAPNYIEDMLANFSLISSNENSNGVTGEEDPLYNDVVAFIMETKKVSASSIQRKFSIGYNRAARIVDAMESAGLVSPLDRSGKRELLI